MNGEDIKKLLSVPTVAQSALDLYGAQGALLILLYKLDVVGMRRVTHTMASMLIGTKSKQPPCSIMLPIVSLGVEYLQFCPKYLGDEEFKRKR